MKKLFTIGYEGCKPSDLFAKLQDNGVGLLIDVRDVPLVHGTGRHHRPARLIRIRFALERRDRGEDLADFGQRETE